MSVPADLRTGTRDLLVAAGLITSTGVFYGALPDQPDRAVAITWYPVSAEHTHGIQVRCRGGRDSSTSAEDLADDVRAALHGLEWLVMGDTGVSLLSWRSGARLGADKAGRDEVVANFYATTSDRSTSLVD